MLTKILNSGIDIIVAVFSWALGLLPASPFHFSPVNWGPFADVIGLVFPVSQMAIHMSLILSAFLAYYAVRWALRLIRQIQ